MTGMLARLARDRAAGSSERLGGTQGLVLFVPTRRGVCSKQALLIEQASSRVTAPCRRRPRPCPHVAGGGDEGNAGAGERCLRVAACAGGEHSP